MTEVDIDNVIQHYADQAQAIYDDRLAGDHTWLGLLSEFARDLIDAQSKDA